MTRLFARFELRPGQHRPRHLRNGLIAAVVLLLVLATTMNRRVPFWPHGGTTISAELASGINLNKTTPVRVNGVEVGRVASVARSPNGRGVVATMRITDHDLDLRHDATAAVHYRTLLGLNMSIDIDPGSPSAPPLGKRPIPLAQTQSQTEIDELLQPLDATGRTAVQTAAEEFDRAFSRPSEVAASVRQLAPGLGAIARGVPALRGTEPGTDLPALVRDAGRTMGALSRDEVALGGLIDHADITLGVTAARGDAMGRSLRVAPRTLASTAATMTRLNATLDELEPVARGLLPGARELDATLVAAHRTLDVARPLLRDARPALVSLASATRVLRDRVAGPGSALVTDLKPVVDRVDDTIIPFLHQRDSQTKMPNYQAIGPTIAHADSLTSNFDDNGHTIVFEPSGGSRTVKGADCTSALLDPEETGNLDCRAVLDVIAKLLGLRPQASMRKRGAR